MHVDDAFHRAIEIVAEAAPIFRDDWILIGSAAAKLAGADVGPINDIDLLISENDIRALKEHWRGRPILPAGQSKQFRSKVFCRFEAPLPIEAMAVFELKTPKGDWIAIKPKTRVQYGNMFTPDVSEQIDLLKLMNRPKDTPRLEALSRLLSN